MIRHSGHKKSAVVMQRNLIAKWLTYITKPFSIVPGPRSGELPILLRIFIQVFFAMLACCPSGDGDIILTTLAIIKLP